VEESKSNSSVSGFSQSVCNHNKELMDPFVSSGEDDDNEEGGEHSKDKGDYAEEEIPHIGEVTGANAMLTDMPDEDSTLDHAILSDIIRQYSDYEETMCNSPSSPAVNKTSFSFEYPGTNPTLKWNPDFVGIEESLFQAVMLHKDGGHARKLWSIRIGTGGQMYNHFASGSYGETMPPQNNFKAPWVDKVQQLVSITLRLNQNLSNPQYCPGPNKEDPAQCKKYYIHHAGTYQKDGNYTSVPFFSPALVSHCERNFCMFAT
jgi:hypothetical protein